MKKIITFLLMAVVAVALSAEAKKQPVVKFNETTYNFGTIPERGGKVSHTFEFTMHGAGISLRPDSSGQDREDKGDFQSVVPSRIIRQGGDRTHQLQTEESTS